MFGIADTRQPQTKLPKTAATETKLLKPFQRCVNNVIAIALANGKSKSTQGKAEFMGLTRKSTRMNRMTKREQTNAE
jgi:hypothetical protein